MPELNVYSPEMTSRRALYVLQCGVASKQMELDELAGLCGAYQGFLNWHSPLSSEYKRWKINGGTVKKSMSIDEATEIATQLMDSQGDE